VLVRPAIDRLAFVLEPDGVKVHGMTAGDNDLSGLSINNVAEEPGNRRGSKPIWLKSGQRITMKLEIVADKVLRISSTSRKTGEDRQRSP
jgi:hypothetical protein